jgi:HD-like signal output (HDOD) protein
MRVQEILSSENADTKELDRLISEDPAIVAALLRLANSAAFGGLRQVEDPVMEALGLNDLTVATMMVDMDDHLVEMKRLF